VITGDDPLEFVLSANLHRRHPDESRRAMVAGRLATLEHGSNQWTGKFAAPTPTQAEAGDLFYVSERSPRHGPRGLFNGRPQWGKL
jgi:hypothetical protein